ncbi:MULTISPECIES: RNA-binding S4 domain-containing protein [unclassified Minwuia]|jgi:ribosome-associated heat shock protein Hsp15|uniref:RNA-binding S4 domain-containing protein n=1 Tax=unclassified Minwuia TaxID=2618799 RepID=UPI002479FB22|nr:MULTISPECIES: RNA-binding S4 domain-containing protein [unclassified Minwuia]
METPAQGSIRIDLWLWYARFFKSRSLAARAVKGSRMRLNRQVIRKVSQPLRVGDVLTIPWNGEIRVIEIAALGERRGPASEAQALYRDRTVADTAAK